MIKKILIILLILFFGISKSYSDIVKKIIIEGNNRVSKETIIMFSSISTGDNLDQNSLNVILKNLYETNFFKDVSVKLENNNLVISIIENPLIENINYNGIESEKIKKILLQNLNLKSRSSYNELTLKKDKDLMLSNLKELGYHFSTIDVFVENLKNNKVEITYDIFLGNKARIKKISFIGNKIFKDSKLRSMIISEEYKFWKFISGKKYLNENLVEFDKKLLKNFYLNNGYYDVSINSSFARIIDKENFQLIYNIDAKNKFYFGDLKLQTPIDFDRNNFSKLLKLLNELKGEPYSINAVNEILEEIDKVSIEEQFEAISATVNENIVKNKINLTFSINETEKFVIERVNIYGNNVTRESVIRNQLEIDEGDIYLPP